MAKTHYEHFTIEPLAEGVYAAVVTPLGTAAANSGVVVLGDRTVLFDTTATIPAAQELRRIAEDLTGRPPTYVINSHVHPDHVHGNRVFADDAILIASEDTREAMAETGLQLMEGFHQQIADAVRGVEAQLATATGETQRAALLADLQRGRAFLEGFPAPEDYRLPHQTFTDELVLRGGGRTARLIACGEAHSEGDSVLYLPAERILFTGDLVTEGDLIFRYGNPDRWLQVLDRLDGLDAEILVPGHGRVLTAGAGIQHARDYITDFLRDIAAAMANGATEEYASTIPVPEGADAYWFRDNVRALIKRFSGER